tara:strand:+ start:906 stop:1898 length:993 start_codon:yes stop_codon:yes gene_type:complete
VIWYRLPIGQESYNWDPSTWQAVMLGRVASASWQAQARVQADGLVEIELLQASEVAAEPPRAVQLTWRSGDALAWDGQRHYNVRALSEQALLWQWPTRMDAPLLAQGTRWTIGWLRIQDAADCFWNADSWEDCAYVLERLLSIDELIQWVQSHFSELDEEADYYDGDPQALLARRLMREGRFELALEHFQPDASQQAEAYLRAMRSANDLSQEAAIRARHFWEAACLMREYGMLLFAAELAPDYAWTEGSLEWGDVALARQNRLYSYGNPINEPSGEEVDRAKQTQILPDKRYHYRYRAVRLAELGASLLPRHRTRSSRRSHQLVPPRRA